MISPKKVVARYQKEAGAVSFSVYSGVSDPKVGFREAVEDAREDYGSGGYTGTIAEKGSFKVRSEPMAYSKAVAFADEDVRDNDKWGPAFAVPIAQEKILEQSEFVISVKAKDKYEAQEIAKKEMLNKGRAKAGVTTLVEEVQTTKKLSEGGAAKVSFDKTVAEVYYFHSGDSRKKYTDKKQALEAAVAWVNNYPVGEKVSVSKIETYGNVVKEAEAKKLPEWEVKGTIKKVALGPVKGYLFYGMASS